MLPSCCHPLTARVHTQWPSGPRRTSSPAPPRTPSTPPSTYPSLFPHLPNDCSGSLVKFYAAVTFIFCSTVLRIRLVPTSSPAVLCNQRRCLYPGMYPDSCNRTPTHLHSCSPSNAFHASSSMVASSLASGDTSRSVVKALRDRRDIRGLNDEQSIHIDIHTFRVRNPCYGGHVAQRGERPVHGAADVDVGQQLART